MESNIQNMLKSIDDITESLKKIEHDNNISDEEKIEKLQKHFQEFSSYQSILDNMMKVIDKQNRKRSKISKYHLMESIRKYKSFLYSILKIDDNISIESTTDDMYSLIDEIFNYDEYKKKRLCQLYSVAFRNTLKSFKQNVHDIIDDCKNKKIDIIKTVSDFYSSYFIMVVQSITDKYNKEIEELENKQKELEEERIKNEINPVVKRPDVIAKEVSK